MNQLFDENGMLILKQQPKTVHRDRTKHVKYGSSVGKVKEFLSKYDVGDKIKINIVRRSTQLNSLTYILIALKEDGFIDYEMSGRNRLITILRPL